MDHATDPQRSLEEAFLAEQPRLIGLAYRILGSRVDAEDVVQEAWIRIRRHDDADGVDRPAAWLTRVVSRLALDELRTARRRRESYVGPWLPEPVRAGPGPGSSTPTEPEAVAELAESLTVAFLQVLERLDPVERVVLLLADVFSVPFDEIARIVDRSPAACRQVASRARRRVADDHRRAVVRPDDAAAVVAELLGAVAAGEVDRVVALLADDAVLVSDGGPSVHAARRPVVGASRVARFLVNVSGRLPSLRAELTTLNGAPGLVLWGPDGADAAIVTEVVDGRVARIYLVRNPEKLASLGDHRPLV
ncbi:MAG TPA: RNA polymerase sigma factor SigJ [Acidimicrobiales bacterium]|nr:RNA polymerase sigma factor SigJ [Acidimicrobiales bacterium]